MEMYVCVVVLQPLALSTSCRKWGEEFPRISAGACVRAWWGELMARHRKLPLTASPFGIEMGKRVGGVRPNENLNNFTRRRITDGVGDCCFAECVSIRQKRKEKNNSLSITTVSIEWTWKYLNKGIHEHWFKHAMNLLFQYDF